MYVTGTCRWIGYNFHGFLSLTGWSQKQGILLELFKENVKLSTNTATRRHFMMAFTKTGIRVFRILAARKWR